MYFKEYIKNYPVFYTIYKSIKYVYNPDFYTRNLSNIFQIFK